VEAHAAIQSADAISGGKPLKMRRNGSWGESRGVLRMAATSLQRSKTALGASFRRIARHKEGAVAVFATARQLARLILTGSVAVPISMSSFFTVSSHAPVVKIGGALSLWNGAGVLC
jgi:hypothetical protein